jgi:hypothetical protein
MAAAPQNTSYQGRLLDALKQTSSYAQTTAGSLWSSTPSLTFSNYSTGEGGWSSYFIWALLFVFIIGLVLVVVNYMFPNSKIFPSLTELTGQSAGSWDSSWTTCAPACSNMKSLKSLPAYNYSLCFDFQINKTTPTQSNQMKYVLAYKTLSSRAIEFNAIVNKLSTVDPDPCVMVVYNVQTSQINVHFVTRISGNQNSFMILSADVVPRQAYRVGIVVYKNLVELYMNGNWIQSAPIEGTLMGTNTDYIYSAPSEFSSFVYVQNLFTTGRAVTSGEMRSMGTPAISNTVIKDTASLQAALNAENESRTDAESSYFTLGAQAQLARDQAADPGKTFTLVSS